MIKEAYIEEYFNKVNTLTAVCCSTSSWAYDDCTGLEIGKTYHVTHIGVLKSSTNVILEEFGNRVFNSTCFEIYENGESIDKVYAEYPRFWAPCLRKSYKDSGSMFLNRQMETEAIPARLSEIEDKYDVKILFAAESGSRAWGFASKDSDWDVRFIYVHKPEWYFCIDEQRDVIEEVYEEDIDAVGWDVKKALTLLKRSNPSLLEWINSPIRYRYDDNFIAGFNQLAQDFFNPIKAMYHYQRIYIKHDERYLQKQGYPMKRFMYYLRGLLACQWIERYNSMPPVSFNQLYEGIVEDKIIKDGIKDLVKAKSSGKETDMSEVPQYLVDYCQPLAKYFSEFVEKYRPDYNDKGSSEQLNRFFYETVTGDNSDF